MKKNKVKLFTALLAVMVCMCGFSVTAYAGGPDYVEPTAAVTNNPMTETEKPEEKPLTPDGNGTVVDNVTNEDGKEFYTVITPDEHTFFLVIDKQRDADNVYFRLCHGKRPALPCRQGEQRGHGHHGASAGDLHLYRKMRGRCGGRQLPNLQK